MARRRRRRLPSEPVLADVLDLSHDGRGVCRIDGKAVFVDGALPGEQIEFVYTAQTRDFDRGRTTKIIQTSPDRVEPRCPHASTCGGCSLQHMDPRAQILAKQKTLIDNLSRIGNVTPETILEPLTGDTWGYRRRGRLSVRHVVKKERVLVGFREKGGRFVTDSQECHVLVPEVGFRIAEIAALMDTLDAKDQIPQIEVAAGDGITMLVWRHMVELGSADIRRLQAFGARTGLAIALQAGGPRDLLNLDGDDTLPELTISVPEELTLVFEPTGFVQINDSINQKMIATVIEKLQLTSTERVLDLFCGLGNFSLPISQAAATVVAVEGAAELVEFGRINAERNGIANVSFEMADLTAEHPFESFDRVLIDPPRSGAKEVLDAVVSTGAERIVYVSCHPGSLARDAGILVNEHGYRLVEAGVMDMFPHTGHVESLAVFVRGN